MLARLQRFTTCVIVAASMLWAIVFLAQGSPVLALLGSAALFSSHAVILAVEFAMMVWVSFALPGPRPPLAELIRAWGKEAATGWQIFFWRQPFRANAHPDFLPASMVRHRGVVLVHGLVCNRGLWNPWMLELQQRQVPFVAVNLEPIFGSLDDYPPAIEAAVQRVEAATGQAPVIVAHSMGGLAVRAWRDTFKGDSRAHRIITVGTPHHGTWLARLTRTRNGKQMRQGADWLKRLAEREQLTYTGFICFFSRCDNVVFPAATATLAGADNREIAGAAHLHMLFQGDVFKELCHCLEGPDDATPCAVTTPRKALTQSLDG